MDHSLLSAVGARPQHNGIMERKASQSVSRPSAGLEHRAPLFTQVTDLLEALYPITGHSRNLFPSICRPRRPRSKNMVNAVLGWLGYDKTQMTGHGFRVTARALLNESRKWLPDAIERHLAHVARNDAWRAYLRGQHWNEQIRMMQYWGDYLDRLRAAEKMIKARFWRR